MGKKSDKIKYFVIAPIIAGIALLVTGLAVGRNDLTYAGIGVLFGGSFLTAVIICIIAVICTLTDKNSEGSKRKNDVLAEAQSRSCDGRTDVGEAREKLDRAVIKRRRKDLGAKIFSVAFILVFVGCLFGGMALLSFGSYVAGGVVFGCGPAMIIIAIAVTAIYNAGRAKKYDVGRIEIGDVVSCELATHPYGAPELARYDVWVEIGEERYFAKADRSYKSGERVRCRIKQNYKDITVEGPTEYSYARGDIEKEQLGAGSDGSEKKTVVREVALSVADPEKDREKAELNELITRLAEVKRSKLKKADKIKAYDEIMSSMCEKRATDKEITESGEKEAGAALAHRIVEITRSENMTEKEKFDARRAAIREHFEGRQSGTTAPTEAHSAQAQKKAQEIKPENIAAPILAPSETAKTDNAERDNAAAKGEKKTLPQKKRAAVAYKGIKRKSNGDRV